MTLRSSRASALSSTATTLMPLSLLSGISSSFLRTRLAGRSAIGSGLDASAFDLNHTSRIVAGTLTMEFKEVDLKQVVRASVETLRVQAAEKGIAVATLVEIPEAVNCMVLGDEARLHQILSNLLGNSLKFTPSGGSVTVQLRKTRASAIIVVRDTGKGISPEFLPHIFKRFSQDGASSREKGGLGLGLAICKHLVELHGGLISAESAGPDRGAMIKVK